MQARRGGGLDYIALHDVPGPSGLRGEQPDEAARLENGLRVDQQIGEVVVVRTAPRDDRIGHRPVILVLEFGSHMSLDCGSKPLVHVVVPAEFLNYLAWLEA